MQQTAGCRGQCRVRPHRRQEIRRGRAGRHDVLARFPSVHDGYECLGRLHQAKGDHHQAVDCYRRVIAFAATSRTSTTRHFVDHFQDLIDRLEPQSAAGG